MKNGVGDSNVTKITGRRVGESIRSPVCGGKFRIIRMLVLRG